jgi:hypothetical protein
MAPEIEPDAKHGDENHDCDSPSGPVAAVSASRSIYNRCHNSIIYVSDNSRSRTDAVTKNELLHEGMMNVVVVMQRSLRSAHYRRSDYSKLKFCRMTSYNIDPDHEKERKEEERGLGAPDTATYGGTDGASGEPGAESL